MNLNRSLILNSPIQSPLQNRRNRHLLQREDTLNLSSPLNDFSTFRTLNDTSLRQALDESSVLGATGYAGDGLSESFFEIIQTSHPSDLLNTLYRLGEVCSTSLEQVESWKRYNAENYWLAEEANTWNLLHKLYNDIIKEHPQSLENIPPNMLSQLELVEHFVTSDNEVRLLSLLVNWLEECASQQEEAFRTGAPITGNVQWGNTLHQLIIGSSLFNKEKHQDMITCLDPDAPKRQKKSIHSDDKADDDNLCKRVFTEIRCGKFENAINICVNAGQQWRAGVLHGVKLLHYQPGSAVGRLTLSGNTSRDLWKCCCLNIVNDVKENVYYRATLGILIGHLPSALTACHGNWKDLLWAHLKVQIEQRVHNFLHEHYATATANTTPSEVLEMLESGLQFEETSLEKIFNSINALMDGKPESHYQKCQRNLMLGHVRALMVESLDCSDFADFELVRFLAHLVLILRQMGKDPQHEMGDKILEKYVEHLINRLTNGSIEYPNLVAYYTATVPPARQIDLYADLMARIEKSDCRKEVVDAGIRAQVDVAASARVAIKKAITAINENYASVDMTITQIDKNKPIVQRILSSLEWLALLPDQYQDALWLNNTIIRTFIFMGNCEAATLILTGFQDLFTDFIKNVPTNSSELREYLSLKTYLEALEHFGVWHRHYSSGRPKEIEPLATDATFSDKVVHEQRVAQYEQQKTRWTNAVQTMSRQTKTMLYNVLNFPGGWLLDDNESISSENFNDQEKSEREKQLDTLRRLCIPEVVILILKILQCGMDTESHQEALKLSDLLADDNSCLFEVFTKDKLSEVLERIKESCFVLMEKGKDIFGYDMNNE